MKSYSYTMKGTAADDQSWQTEGTIEIEPVDFPDVSMIALKDTFTKLTQGRAVFGYPGVGCRGPYEIRELLVKLIE